MYTAADFYTRNAPKEMVQYVIDNVEDFEPRYRHALSIMEDKKCPLQHADASLYDDLYEAMYDWAMDNKESYPEDFDYDIEEIFG